MVDAHSRSHWKHNIDMATKNMQLSWQRGLWQKDPCLLKFQVVLVSMLLARRAPGVYCAALAEGEQLGFKDFRLWSALSKLKGQPGLQYSISQVLLGWLSSRPWETRSWEVHFLKTVLAPNRTCPRHFAKFLRSTIQRLVYTLRSTHGTWKMKPTAGC